MTIRFYVLPLEVVIDADGAHTRRGPKYMNWRFTTNPTPIDCPWSLKDYGLVGHGIVCADIQPSDHTALVANNDVLALPVNLDTNPTQGQVNAAKTFLENRNIPAGWVTTALTYRQILKTILGILFFIQRVHTIMGRNHFADSGVTLDTTLGAIPVDARNALSQAATDMGFDTSGLTGTTTLRVALKSVADQWGARPMIFGNLGSL